MITKTQIGNHLRRHALGDQSTFRQGFKEGVEFVLSRIPQQRTWVGLTRDEIQDLLDIVDHYNYPQDLIVYTQAKLKDKNL